MDYHDEDEKGLLRPSHTNIPGVGLVPTGPSARRREVIRNGGRRPSPESEYRQRKVIHNGGRRPSEYRQREVIRNGGRQPSSELEYRQGEVYRNSVRRPSPESECRQRDVFHNDVRPEYRRKESFRDGVRRPSPVPDRRSARRQSSGSSFWINPENVKAKNENAPQGSDHKSSLSEITRGRALVKPERLSPERESTERNESPSGLFVPQDYSDRELNHVESDNLDDSSEDGTIPGNDAVGDFDLGTGESENDSSTSDEPAGACQCPISLQCGKRADHLIDCRPLVLEWKKWGDRILPQFNAQLNAAVPAIHAAFTTVDRVNDMHAYCDRVKRYSAAHPSDRTDYKRMITWAAEMHTHSITQAILTVTQILPRLQTFLSPPGVGYHVQKLTPMNLLEELKIIFRKWSKGDLLADANRGIIREIVQTSAGTRQVERLDRSWPHRVSDSFYGHGHLVNGQRWFSRLQMSRDGAHGAPQAGICGRKELGARSIVMGLHDEQRHRFYADVDGGETIWYIGTALEALKIMDDPEPKQTNFKDTEASRNREHRRPTDATQALMKSRRTKIPVRVFRSYRLADIVSHKPKDGFRYDGLYRVVGWKCLKKDRQIYRFKMRRLRRNDPVADGQGGLRGVKRPRE